MRCMDGNCVEPGLDDNTDFNTADISLLDVPPAINDDLRRSGYANSDAGAGGGASYPRGSVPPAPTLGFIPGGVSVGWASRRYSDMGNRVSRGVCTAATLALPLS